MSVLVLAPHADDEVLGAGATIAKFVDAGEEVVVAILTGKGRDSHLILPDAGFTNTRRECKEACDVLGVQHLIFRELPAACLDHTPVWEINRTVQEIVEEFKPDQMFIPFANDLHKDHGAIAYATSVVTRPYLTLGSNVQRVLAYETLSETHLAPCYLEPAFQPQLHVDVAGFLDRKLEAFGKYKSQIQTDNLPRSLKSITALAHLRGSYIGSEAAEAFVILREIQ